VARCNKAALLLALAAGAPAAAQVPGDPGIDQRVRQIQRDAEDARRRTEQEAILTGRNDIVLMRRRRFFTLSGSASLGITDNATLSPSPSAGDILATFEASLGFSTRLGGLVDVSAEIGLNTARYFDNKALDVVAGYAQVAAHVEIVGFDLDLSYTPNRVWDGDFEQRQLTQHRFSAGLSRSFALGRVLVRASVGGERIEANPTAFKNWAANAGLSAILPLGARASLTASLRGTRRWYDDYFEGLLGFPRRDWQVEAAAGFALRFGANASLDLRATHTRNYSTADISRYRATSAGVALRAAFRF
jgi:opacity protein-like surface antigen